MSCSRSIRRWSNWPAEDPQAAQLVKLRYFGGFSVGDAAEHVGLSRSTAYEHWAYARAWLHRRLRHPDTDVVGG
jgi:DNA-directed RNA polymerase specialized sigma24 family protein